MDDGVLGILGFVLIFVVLDVAALRFGHDSRSMSRELPLLGDAVVRIPPQTGRHVQALLTLESLRGQALRVRPAPSRSFAPITRVQRRSRPFRPYIAGDVHAYPRFDMAAVGK